MLITFSLKNHILPFSHTRKFIFVSFNEWYIIDNFIYNSLIYHELWKDIILWYIESIFAFLLKLCDIFDCIIFHLMNFQLIFRSLIPSFGIIFEELSTFTVSFAFKFTNLFIICILICYQYYWVYKKNWIRKCKVITAKFEVYILPFPIKLNWF